MVEELASCRGKKKSEQTRVSSFLFLLQVVILALITSLVNFPNRYTRGLEAQLLEVMLAECDEHENSKLCE
jgi:hypothetical protein